MKILNNSFKIIILLLVSGMFFFSCEIDNAETGVLTISLPGSSARALQPYFIDSLRYKVECLSESYPFVTETFSAGDSKSISLAPGKWSVTVNVLDVNDRTKGKMTKDVSISAGKNTNVSFNEIKINDDEGKNILSLNISDNKAGFDIVHSRTNSSSESATAWNDVVPIDFHPGDVITIRGLYSATQNENIILLPLNISPSIVADAKIKDGYKKFLEVITLTVEQVDKIKIHNSEGGATLNAPNGIRVKFAGTSIGKVYIEQLLIERGDTILLDFSDHLQRSALMNSEMLGDDKFSGIFSVERHLIGANSNLIRYQVREWKDFLN